MNCACNLLSYKKRRIVIRRVNQRANRKTRVNHYYNVNFGFYYRLSRNQKQNHIFFLFTNYSRFIMFKEKLTFQKHPADFSGTQILLYYIYYTVIADNCMVVAKSYLLQSRAIQLIRGACPIIGENTALCTRTYPSPLKCVYFIALNHECNS